MAKSKIEGGYTLRARRRRHSPIRRMPPLYQITWDYLIDEANHDEQVVDFTSGEKVIVKRGEKITSIRKIAHDLTWIERGIEKTPNPKTIRNILTWLEGEKMIAVKSNSQYTHIIICNYSLYQNHEHYKSNSQETVRKQSADTNNEVKELKEPKELNNKPKEKDNTSRKLEFTPDDYLLAESISDHVLTLNPQNKNLQPDKKEATLKKWANTVRLMREQDGRSLSEIDNVLTWALKSDFWPPIIQSATSLRRNYDTILPQIRSKPKNGTDDLVEWINEMEEEAGT
jgi:hypothetical protein